MNRSVDDYSSLGSAPVRRRGNPFQGQEEDGPSVEQVPVNSIEVGNNPRKHFDPEKIKELSQSIKASGLLQPIVVQRRLGKVLLIAGERRLRAFRHLKRKNIPAIVVGVDALHPDKAPLARIAENLQRADLEPGELAQAVAALVAQGQRQADIAQALGKSKTWVSRKVAHAQLVESYPEASKIETTTASRIQSAPEESRAEMVQEALAGTNIREQFREKFSTQKGRKSKPREESLEKLQKERERLIKRLEQIDNKIAELGGAD